MSNLRWAGVELVCRCGKTGLTLYHIWPAIQQGVYELLCSGCYGERLKLEKRRVLELLGVQKPTGRIQ